MQKPILYEGDWRARQANRKTNASTALTRLRYTERGRGGECMRGIQNRNERERKYATILRAITSIAVWKRLNDTSTKLEKQNKNSTNEKETTTQKQMNTNNSEWVKASSEYGEQKSSSSSNSVEQQC